MQTTDEETFDRLYRVNVKSVFLCTQAALPQMRRGGVVLNMASIASFIGLNDRFAYSMTKGAVLDFYQRIASRLLPYLYNRPATLERLPEGIHGADVPHFW